MDKTFLPIPSSLKSSVFLFSKSTGVFAANCASETDDWEIAFCPVQFISPSPQFSCLREVISICTLWQMISEEKVAIVRPPMFWFPFPTICTSCSTLQPAADSCITNTSRYRCRDPHRGFHFCSSDLVLLWISSSRGHFHPWQRFWRDRKSWPLKEQQYNVRPYIESQLPQPSGRERVVQIELQRGVAGWI